MAPNQDVVGDVYIAEVTGGYHYFHSVPEHSYEHWHRLGVRWDTDAGNAPIAYRAGELGISIRGGL